MNIAIGERDKAIGTLEEINGEAQVARLVDRHILWAALKRIRAMCKRELGK